MAENTYIKTCAVVLGLFLIAGIGLGLTGYVGVGFVADTFVQEGEENPFAGMFVVIVFLQSVIVTLFAGPLVASLAGIVAGFSLRHRGYSLMVGGCGSFLGFFMMVSIAVFLMTLALPEMSGGGGSDGGGTATGFSGLVHPMLKSAIPTTAAGFAASYLGTYIPTSRDSP